MKTTTGMAKINKKETKSWCSQIGGNKPPQSRVPLLPKNMNKPFLTRLKEWWTK